MNLLRLSFTRVMVAMAAIAPMVACGGEDEPTTQLPALKLNVEVENITTTTAKIKVTHDFEAKDSWYGFVTDDTTTDAKSLVGEVVANGIDQKNFHRSKQYVSLLESLAPDTNYRYIATGLTAEGVQYGGLPW